MNRKAFTLIELLVVIGIIGILSGFVALRMGEAINAANDAKKQADLAAVKKALIIYGVENGNTYPVVESGCTIGSCPTLDTAMEGLLPETLNGTYTYQSDATGSSFEAATVLSSGYAYIYDSTTNTFETKQPTSGICGTANKAYSSTDTSYNADTFCATGTANPTTPIFPSVSTPTSWTCAGTNGGATVSCTASVSLNGACGSSSGSVFYSAPSSNLCSTGTASAVTGSYSWTCAGQNGGTTASCSAVGFAYKKTITITNNVSAQTDYSVQMTVAYNSHMNANFSDLRFTSSTGTILPYWVESYTSSSSANVWVKVPSLALGSTVIYMYYGNASATSASNGVNTFPVFDDFSGTLNNWTTGNGSISISGGRIYISGGNYNDANAFFRYNQTVTINSSNTYVAKFFNWAGTPSSAGYNWSCGFFSNLSGYRVWSTNQTNAYMSITDHTSADYVQVGAYQAGTSVFSSTVSNVITQANNISIVYGTGLYKAYYGDGNLIHSSTSSSLNPGVVYVGCTNYDGGAYAGNASFDGVLARKYLSTEPSVSIGSEQSN